MKFNYIFILPLLTLLLLFWGSEALLVLRSQPETRDGSLFVFYWFSFERNESYVDNIPGYGRVSVLINQSDVRMRSCLTFLSHPTKVVDSHF